MSATVRQVVTGFAAATVTTVSADFTDGASGGIGAALAGSCIVFIVAGDKNSGTFTPPSDTPNVPVDLKTADVSLMAAWGTADGGETVVSGTIGANLGGSQITLVELVDTVNTGAWTVTASATHNSDGTNVAAWSTGTTGAAAIDGVAVAAVAADSVNTAGTPAWSNSFSAVRITPSGGGQAGLWNSTKAITAGATAESTLTRTGGTADQHSGAILVMGRAAGSNNGVLAATVGRPVAALTGLVRDPGALGVTLALPVGSLQGSPIDRAALAATLALPVAALTGLVRVLAVLGATLPPPIGTIAGTAPAVGQLGAALPLPVFSAHEVPPALVLPLAAGQPVLAPTWAAGGTPELAASWSAGQPVRIPS